MAALPYMQLYVAEYLADTCHLNAAQHGAYLLLLMNYWQRGKPLSDLNDRLAIVARMSNEEWRINRDVIAEFFQIQDGLWLHDRVERDLEKVKGISEAGRAAGIASGKARKQRSSNGRSTDDAKPLDDYSTNDEPLRTDTYTEAEAKDTPRAKKPRGEPTKSDLIKTRHAEFKEKIKQYWEYKNPGVEMPWGPAEGKQLAMWLAESPLTTIEQFAQFLRHRAMSEVNHAERPSRWIGNVTSFANGPINAFKQPLNGGKPNGKIDRSVEIAAKLVAEFENNSRTNGRELLSGG